MTDSLLAALERLEGAVRESAVPVTHRWIGAAQIAAMLGYTKRYCAERVVCQQDFPKPLRAGGTGDPRWRMDEVQAWAEQQRATGGPQSRRRSRRSTASATADRDAPQSSPA